MKFHYIIVLLFVYMCINNAMNLVLYDEYIK